MGAAQRGWGPGWPKCQTSKIITLRRPDGVVLPVRREISLLIAGLCDETERRGYNLVPGWCWGFACRAIRGTKVPSNHSWALAVDLNAPKNPMGSTLVTDMPPWLPKLWKAYGFGWGGDYPRRPDAMHMEYLGTPESAVVHTRKLYGDLLPPDFEEDAMPLSQDDINKIVAAVTPFTKAVVHEVLVETGLVGVPDAVGKDRRMDREALVQTLMAAGMAEDDARELAAEIENTPNWAPPET